MKNVKVEVTGMTCGSCVRRVQEALDHVDGVTVTTVDRRGADLEVSDDVADADIVKAVRGAGYEASLMVLP